MANPASKNRSAKKPASTPKAKAPPAGKKRVLHIGLSSAVPGQLHKGFTADEWDCVRLDPDPNVKPDLRSNVTDLEGVEVGSFDAVWVPHVLQRLHPHDAASMLHKIFRAIKDECFVVLQVPDARTAATYVANNRPHDTVYTAPVGDITAMDMLYGYSKIIAKGAYHLAHRYGYTAESLANLLRDSGFCSITVRFEGYDLFAVAHRYDYDNPRRVEKITVSYPKDSAENAPPPIPEQPQKTAVAPSAVSNMKNDLLELPPAHWKPLGLGLKK